MRLKKTYSSREVAALTGLTARQLQLWDARRADLARDSVAATAAGGYTERRYTPIELFELLVLADLRRRGFSVHQLHTILRVLDEQFGVRLFDATGGGGVVQLLTDGRRSTRGRIAGKSSTCCARPTQPLLVVGNEGLLKELSASHRPKRRGRREGKRASGSGKSSRGRRPGAE